MRKWKGKLPKICEVCFVPLVEKFIDGETIYSAGATAGMRVVMCTRCHAEIGKGWDNDGTVQYDIRTRKEVTHEP